MGVRMASASSSSRVFRLEGPLDEGILKSKGVVNATGKGSRDQAGTTPLSTAVLASCTKGIWLLDLAGLPVLHPTPLMNKAASRDLVVSHGAKMVAHQVACQLRVITGLRVEPDAMEKALEEQLQHELDNVVPLVQEMALEPPLGGPGGITGEANFAKLRAAWLEGERTRSGEPLPVPEEVEQLEDSLRQLVTDHASSRRVEAQVPLRSVMDALGSKWIADKTM